jgi:hypothetical protein
MPIPGEPTRELAPLTCSVFLQAVGRDRFEALYVLTVIAGLRHGCST